MSITNYIPVNSAGKPDGAAVAAAEQEIARGINTVIVAAHGWTTPAVTFMDDVDRMAAGLGACLDLSSALILPVHWRSSLSDDAESPEAVFDAASFYAMRDRADAVGSGAVYRVMSALSSIAASRNRSLLFITMGHSFGVRVVLSAMNVFGAESFRHGSPKFAAVLLQGACDYNALEPGHAYQNVVHLSADLLATTSATDKALNEFYPLASRSSALGGSAGPSEYTRQVYGSKLSVVDITAMQAADPEPEERWGGSHSKIYGPQVCGMIAEFIGKQVGA